MAVMLWRLDENTNSKYEFKYFKNIKQGQTKQIWTLISLTVCFFMSFDWFEKRMKRFRNDKDHHLRKKFILTISKASDNLNRISLDILEKRGTLFRKCNFSSIFFIPVCIMTCWNTVRSNIHTSPGVIAANELQYICK